LFALHSTTQILLHGPSITNGWKPMLKVQAYLVPASFIQGLRTSQLYLFHLTFTFSLCIFSYIKVSVLDL